MTKKELVRYHNYLYFKYKGQVNIQFANISSDDFYACIPTRTVTLPDYIKSNQSEWSLFAFLHEIGHIMTNTTKMKRCEQEYLATQWAIEEAKRIKFKIPKRFLETYQNYIWEWRERGVKSRAKSIPTKDQLTLSY